MKRILIISGIVIALGAIGAGIYVYQKNLHSPVDETAPTETPTETTTEATSGTKLTGNVFNRNLSRGQCEGSGTKTFTHLPMDIGDIGAIQPYGIMVGAHVIPTSHGYFSPTEFNGPRDQYPVYAIADSTIVNVSHRGQAVGDNQDPSRVTDEYQLWFEHSCAFYTYYDLLTSLSADLQAEVGTLTGFDNKNVRIPVTAGQLVGRVGGQTVDFGVWNFEKSPAFFANPDSYEEDRPYLDDMFAYFTEPLKAQLLTKAVRVVEPRSGTVSYDIAGKLVGGWFREGSGGFEGPPNIHQTGDGRYWDGHLAIVYDFIDPTAIIVSFGNWEGSAKQFTVKGNAPDPANVDVNSGPIKYELTTGSYINGYTGEGWMVAPPIANPRMASTDRVTGTVLVQLLSETQLKVEQFPGKTAAEVTDFTANAQIYTR